MATGGHVSLTVRTGRVVAVANQKGGVGKTTTAVNLGASLAEMGIETLVVDLDPQGNASTGLGLDHASRRVTVYDLLTEGATPEETVAATPFARLHAIPSTVELAGAEIELVSEFARETRLRKGLEPLKERFPVILVDCPPSLGLLTINALAAAEEILIPIQCEYYALEGVGQLMKNVELVRQNINPKLRLNGIVLTMYDARTKLAEQVEAEIRGHFGDDVYASVIPRSVRLSEAPGFGRPVIHYDPSSRGASAYRALAREFAARQRRREGDGGPWEEAPGRAGGPGDGREEGSAPAADAPGPSDLPAGARAVPDASVRRSDADAMYETTSDGSDATPAEEPAGERRSRWPFRRERGERR